MEARRDATAPAMPRWVKAVIVVAVVVVLAVAAVVLTGGEHGPGRHTGAGDAGRHAPPPGAERDAAPAPRHVPPAGGHAGP
jgi:hypothetical protein